MDGWVTSDSARRLSQFSDIFWRWFPLKHSALENVVQQLSVSSLFFAQGQQLMVAGSSATPGYTVLTPHSPRALIHTKEMKGCPCQWVCSAQQPRIVSTLCLLGYFPMSKCLFTQLCERCKSRVSHGSAHWSMPSVWVNSSLRQTWHLMVSL